MVVIMSGSAGAMPPDTNARGGATELTSKRKRKGKPNNDMTDALVSGRVKKENIKVTCEVSAEIITNTEVSKPQRKKLRRSEQTDDSELIDTNTQDAASSSNFTSTSNLVPAPTQSPTPNNRIQTEGSARPVREILRDYFAPRAFLSTITMRLWNTDTPEAGQPVDMNADSTSSVTTDMSSYRHKSEESTGEKSFVRDAPMPESATEKGSSNKTGLRTSQDTPPSSVGSQDWSQTPMEANVESDETTSHGHAQSPLDETVARTTGEYVIEGDEEEAEIPESRQKLGSGCEDMSGPRRSSRIAQMTQSKSLNQLSKQAEDPSEARSTSALPRPGSPPVSEPEQPSHFTGPLRNFPVILFPISLEEIDDKDREAANITLDTGSDVDAISGSFVDKLGLKRLRLSKEVVAFGIGRKKVTLKHFVSLGCEYGRHKSRTYEKFYVIEENSGFQALWSAKTIARKGILVEKGQTKLLAFTVLNREKLTEAQKAENQRHQDERVQAALENEADFSSESHESAYYESAVEDAGAQGYNHSQGGNGDNHATEANHHQANS